MRKNITLSFLTLSLFSAGVTANSNSSFKNGFSGVVTFGDSMSDGGFRETNSRYIAGGFDSKLYNEILSLNYAALQHTPYTWGGTNYAESGSRTDNMDLKVTDQYARYLKDNKNRIDPNALYIMWSGANDISDVVESIPNLLGAFLTGNTLLSPTDAYLNAADKVGEMVKSLSDGGAKYIVVPTIPKAGLSPFTSNTLPSIFDMIGLGGLVGMESTFSELFDQALREAPAVSGNEERNNVIIDAINKAVFGTLMSNPMGNLIGYTPEMTRGFVEKIYGTLYELANNMSTDFNNRVDGQLSQIEGNIIRVDVDKLFDEIIDAPEMYGFRDVLNSPCKIGVPSWSCNESQDFYDASLLNDALFSDWFHPGPLGHAVIADYMMSVIDAPLYVSQLSVTANRLIKDRNGLLDNHLIDLKNRKDHFKRFSVFGGYNGSQSKVKGEVLDGTESTNGASIGVSSMLNDNFSIGGLFSIESGDYNSKDLFQYDYYSMMASLFAQYQNGKGLWGNLDLHYGQINFSDINRMMKLGTGLRVESGNTTADSYGARINLGFDFHLGDKVKVGPVLGYHHYKSKILGYQEKGDRSTAMRFYSQSIDASVGKAGLSFGVNAIKYQPFATLVYNHNFAYQAERGIRGGINSTETSFERYVPTDVESWLEAKLGLNYMLSDTFQLYSSLGYTHEDTGTKKGSYNLGMNFLF